MTDTLLDVDEVYKTYGGITAVDGISFSIESGSLQGLIGPNGAGKTTLFDLVSGFQTPDDGTITFDGTDIHELMRPDRQERSIRTLSAGLAGGGVLAYAGANLAVSDPVLGAVTLAGTGGGVALYLGHRRYRATHGERPSRPHQMANHGMVRTFQLTRELDGMTVLENMLLAPQRQPGESIPNVLFRRRAVNDHEAGIEERAHELMELLEIDHLAGEYAANLSGGQRKLLEIGRVLMAEPKLVLLDEPIAGVNPTLTDKIIDRLRALNDEGYTFLVIEHDMDVIMRLSETLVVMNDGKKLVEGTPEEVRNDERVIEAYLGQ